MEGRRVTKIYLSFLLLCHLPWRRPAAPREKRWLEAEFQRIWHRYKAFPTHAISSLCFALVWFFL